MYCKIFSNFAKFKIILSKFCNTRNFDKIILNCAKFKENFAKHKIKNFAKILRNYENKNFAATQCRSRVRGGEGRYSPGAPSALTQIVHYLFSYYTVFHSVIYNSVLLTLEGDVTHTKDMIRRTGQDDVASLYCTVYSVHAHPLTKMTF